MLLSRISFVAVLIASFSACFNVSATEIKTGDIDNRVYQYQVLDNQLRVLLVSDPKADKAAAALNVNVGSYHDPVDREGLAHFLEHMLFLGTEKYPEADEYQAFISDKGGSHNAFTSSHNTNYFFDVDNAQLEPALDRFAQFFIAPLFDEFYVDRERNAVHSEYQSKIQDDFRRGYDVYRSVINPAHPEAKFNVGSLKTLADRPGDNVREDLLEFYKDYYSADKMALVVLGNYPIATLKKMVEQRFKRIPLKKQQEQSQHQPPLFLDNQLPIEVLARPLKELRQMSMNFPLPSIQQYYREKPLDYIAHILGHEGKGSLLSLLKQRGLAEGLSAGGRDKNDGSAAFYLTIQLTKKGIEHRELVRSLVFYSIEQIKQKGIEQWRYQEEKLLSQIAFRFRENATAINTVSALAGNLFRYPVEDVISGSYLLEKYNPALISEFLEYLSPDNVYVTSVFPEADTNRVSEHYQAPYRVAALSTTKLVKGVEALKTENIAFALPEPNPFIPEDLHLFTVDQSLSQASQLSTILAPAKDQKPLFKDMDIWLRQDVAFATPRVKIQFRLYSPAIAGNLKGAAKAKLYAALLQDRLNEYSYPALLAGAAVSVRANNRGLDITVQGYHDRLHKLMAVLLDEIELAQVEPKRFAQLKSETLREWRNNGKKTPYHQLYNQLAVDLYRPYWADKAKINALENVSLEELVSFAKNWRKGVKVKGLFYGNISKEWLQDWQALIPRLSLEGEQSIAPVKVARLGQAKIKEGLVGEALAGESLVEEGLSIKGLVEEGRVAAKTTQQSAPYNLRLVDHNDQAVVLYIQGLDDSLKSQAEMMVLRQILQSPFYSSLRTEQQLGYIVFLSSLQLKEVPGSVFVVQSPSASIEQIHTAITTFINDYKDKLPEDISVYQQAVVTQLLEAPTSLSASAGDDWGSLLRHPLGDSAKPQFEHRQLLASAIMALSAEEIKHAYQQVMQNPANALWVYSKALENTAKQAVFAGLEDYYLYP